MTRKEKQRLVAYILKLSEDDIYDLIDEVVTEVDISTEYFRARVIRGLEKDENTMAMSVNIADIARYLKSVLSRHDRDWLKELL